MHLHPVFTKDDLKARLMKLTNSFINLKGAILTPIIWIIIVVILFFALSILINFLSSRNKKLFAIYVKGKHHTCRFEFIADEALWTMWENEGFDVHKVLGSTPDWVANVGLDKIWYWLQKHYIIPLG
jgi:hypothetical protein